MEQKKNTAIQKKVDDNIQKKRNHNENKENENKHDSILKAFEKDAEDQYSVNKDCGLNNQGQKCSRCKFVTHSMGVLRMHEKKTHKIFNNFDKIVDGFKFDNIKYFEVLKAMYDGK